MANFKNVKSFEELKSQYKVLLKANHPDNGGDVAKMQEINAEYDALFKIWKDRHEEKTGEKVSETAESTRRQFYTENGWEGSNHDWDRSLKEVAQIIRSYVKEKYPTCKFSVRTSYASMCQELHVELKEFPAQMYKTGDDLHAEGLTETVKSTNYSTGEPIEYEHYKPEVEEMLRRLRANGKFKADRWTDEELIAAYEKALEENPFFGIKTEYFNSVIADIDALVNSYNYSDCDGMIDYFNVDFYFFGVQYNYCKLVPKTARVKKTDASPAKSKKAKTATEKKQGITQKTGYTYKVTQGEDTRDGSTLWVVRIAETLDKAAYIAENNRMKELGGYYSKFKRGFIFRFDPTEKITR